jgi:hypothetical protein
MRAALATIAMLATAALLSSCGGGSGLIPARNAATLQTDLNNISDYVVLKDCPQTDDALAQAENDFASLPASVNAALRANLQQGLNALESAARRNCQTASASTSATGTTGPTSATAATGTTGPTSATGPTAATSATTSTSTSTTSTTATTTTTTPATTTATTTTSTTAATTTTNESGPSGPTQIPTTGTGGGAQAGGGTTAATGTTGPPGIGDGGGVASGN